MKAHVVRSIRRPARRTAPGPMGSRPEHWEVLTATHDGVERFASLVVDLALGQVPRGVVRGHSRGEVIAIAKDKGGMRPLVMHSILRRMGLAAVTRITQAQAKVAAGVHQLGIGTPDGCAKAYHALGSLSRTAPGRVILALDVEAAHQSLDRAFMRAGAHQALCTIFTEATASSPRASGRGSLSPRRRRAVASPSPSCACQWPPLAFPRRRRRRPGR